MHHSILEAGKRSCPARSMTGPCIGDHCMAWRWAGPSPVMPGQLAEGMHEYVEALLRRTGYCGLAGRAIHDR